MQPIGFVIALLSGAFLGSAFADDEEEINFADCPPAVRKTLQAEAKNEKIETVTKLKNDDNETIYSARVAISGKTYDVATLENGTLTEVSLAVDDDEDVPLDQCPAVVQATFRSETFGEKVEAVGRDIKYGLTVYQTVVDHKGKKFEIVVAEDGTLVEKVLVIEDDEIKLSDCPAAVRAALHEHAKGGEIGDITRSTGIGQHTFEAEVKMKERVYLIELSESGLLLSKSLEAVKN
jgi:hypothetical protein